LAPLVFSAAIVKPSRRDAGAPRAEPIDTAKTLRQFNSPLRGLCWESGWELGMIATVTDYKIQQKNRDAWF
jgi:hypothetical protein